MGILNKYRDVNKEDNEGIREYFQKCMDTINDNNLYMLRKTCMYISMVYVLMLVVAKLGLPGFYYSPAYFSIVPLMIVYFNINLYTIKHRGNISTGTTAAICCSFYFWLGVCLSAIDCIAAPAGQSIWLPIAVLLFPILYIDRIYKYAFEEIVVLLIMLILSYFFKDKQTFIKDVYIAIAVFAVSMLAAKIILIMRSRESLAMAEVTRLSALDKLTHVLNKGALVERIDSYFLQKPNDESCAMVIIDLDDFKNVNDNLGHTAGDMLLERVGQLLSENFRAYDIVGRYGGDEFVVLMPNMADESILQMRCRALQMFVTDIQIDGNLQFTASIGGIISKGIRNFDRVFGMADDALYKSKILGKNSVTTWVYKDVTFDKPLMLSLGLHEAGKQRLNDAQEDRFYILAATNDDDAIRYISQFSNQIKIILLELDEEYDLGILTLKYIRARDRFATLPVIVVAMTERAKEIALEYYADGILLKDTPDEEYRRIINELMRN